MTSIPLNFHVVSELSSEYLEIWVKYLQRIFGVTAPSR